jgi:ATP-dependent exoDNAse (exonuclease V) beta subunit
MKNVTYISAGAGSGKTFSLTEKLLGFVKNGKCTMSEVILTTFTENAAADFKRKTREKFIQNGLTAAASALDSAHIGTVHSIGLTFIKKYWYLLGLSASVDVIEDTSRDAYLDGNMDGVVSTDDLKLLHKHAEDNGIKKMKSSAFDYNFWKDDVKSILEKADMFDVTDLEANGYSRSEKLMDAFSKPEGKDVEPVCKTIYRIASELRGKFAQYKKEHSLIEFNDMERYFLKLLNIEDVQNEISSSIKYVFVDEFQDSSPIQLQIFDKLSDIVERSFWVGDAKQAIYGFRGCDTALVQAVTKYIKDNRTPDWEKNGGFGVETLNDSWRSVPALVNLANTVFPSILNLPKEDVKLNAKRDEFADCALYHFMFEPGTTKTGRQSFSKDVAVTDLAHAIKDLVSLNTEIQTVVDKDSKEKRALRPSDIAVLCRNNSDVEDLSKAVKACGVAVKTESEIDSDSREVRLLICLLYYMVLDSSLLRAEIEHLLCDEALSNILTEKNDFTSLFEQLDVIKKEMRYEPLSKVVRTLVLHLNLDCICAKWGGWDERKQILLTLVDNAVAYEDNMIKSGNYASIQGFISYLEDDKCKASTSNDGVTITTYHRSKGLEWNIVILYSLDNDAKGKAVKFYLNPDAERVSEPTTENFYSTYDIRYLTRFNGSSGLDSIEVSDEFQNLWTKSLAEENRLLYVGVTRARDYLITCSFNNPKKCSLKWLDNADVKYSLGAMTSYVFGNNIPFKVIDVPYTEITPPEKETSFEVPVSADKNTEIRQKFISPSQVEGSSNANVKLLNDSSREDRIAITPSGHTDAEIGTCLHAALALCRVGKNEANQAAIEKVICNYGMQNVFTNQDVKEKIARMYDMLSQELTVRYGACIREDHELPFCYTSDDNERVSGVMDMLWFTNEGVVVVDFKSYQGGMSQFLDPEDKNYAGKYAAQLALYKKALERANYKVIGTLIYYAVQGRIVEVY